jgi:hypothetical protein
MEVNAQMAVHRIQQDTYKDSTDKIYRPKYEH